MYHPSIKQLHTGCAVCARQRVCADGTPQTAQMDNTPISHRVWGGGSEKRDKGRYI